MPDFVKTPEILSVIAISNCYNVRPSSILQIDNPYEAYCFDEACICITEYIKAGKTPVFSACKNDNSTQQSAVSEMIRLGGEFIEY